VRDPQPLSWRVPPLYRRSLLEHSDGKDIPERVATQMEFSHLEHQIETLARVRSRETAA
jgi:hypothetical protein